MILKGYKCFNGDKTNRYGVPFEEGKDYHVDGEIKYGNKGNGFHMCVHLSDVFRFFDTDDNDFAVAEVTCWGEHDMNEYPDDFEGYYDMYAFSDMHIDRFMTREEIINKMLEAHEFDVKKFLRTFYCTNDEILLFIRKFHNDISVLSVILCYHFQENNTYYLTEEEKMHRLDHYVAEIEDVKKLKKAMNSG